MPCLYLYVFSFSRRKKRLPVHSALKPNAYKLFYLYNCVHLHRTLVYRSNWMILGCYYTKRFHDSYYLQRCTHLCLKKKTVHLKVLVREKINIPPHCKSALSVVLEEFHNKVFVAWFLKKYTGTANVTRNTFLFRNSLPSCFASIRKKLHKFNFGF